MHLGLDVIPEVKVENRWVIKQGIELENRDLNEADVLQCPHTGTMSIHYSFHTNHFSWSLVQRYKCRLRRSINTSENFPYRSEHPPFHPLNFRMRDTCRPIRIYVFVYPSMSDSVSQMSVSCVNDNNG
ncbi:hypothetical protein CEXT_802171 [Caerostris extrusa]|uniref:Uncharacterized protein n=1 Tax=Caerostris extrusa TaxID=172846 RepID=A0AAV4NXY0_CAEEX|nr:hypothetical protein CEXT_802171 [Caerostris extrusa]